MRKNKIFMPFVILAFPAMMWTGCNKDYTYVEPKIDVTKVAPVSFKSDVYPILSAGCLGSNCHDDGTNPPFFSSASQAFDQMWTNDGGNVLIDTVTAENSSLYKRLIKTTSGKMPPSASLPAANLNTILTWIKQGSKNN